MADVIFNKFKTELLKATFNLANGGNTIKVALVSSSYSATDASKQDNHFFWTATAWAATTTYAVGDRRRPLASRSGHIFEVTSITTGISGGSEPTWNTTDGVTTTDSGVTWTCRATGDVQFYEITGTGYTAGGVTLANQAVTQDNTDNEGVYDADDAVWSSSTLTARGAVIYKDTGTPSTSPLIAWLDFTTDKSSSNGTFQIVWNSEGIVNLT
jgi:hypothetical protein